MNRHKISYLVPYIPSLPPLYFNPTCFSPCFFFLFLPFLQKTVFLEGKSCERLLPLSPRSIFPSPSSLWKRYRSFIPWKISMLIAVCLFGLLSMIYMLPLLYFFALSLTDQFPLTRFPTPSTAQVPFLYLKGIFVYRTLKVPVHPSPGL